MNKYIFIILLCITVMSGCKEEYVYPSVTSEFCNVHTTSKGKLSTLITDKDQLLHIIDREGLDGFAKDSIYRCVGRFTVPEDNDSIFLYTLFPTVSNPPVAIDEFLKRNEKGIKRDPVTLQRIWGTRHYINMVLLQKRKEIPHLYYLVCEPIVTDANGVKTATVILHHDRMDDYEAFNSEVYVSIPLVDYNRVMTNGDRIQVKVSTYKNHDETRTFVRKNKNWILTD